MSKTYKSEIGPFKIPNGSEGTNVPENFSIPPCGIEDVDKALFDFFNEHVGFSVSVSGKAQKVAVVFASGERFATVKKRIPIRDKNGALILPIIAIRRTSIEQTDDVRGALRSTGELVISKRLAPEDREYQNIINKRRIANQANISSRANFQDPDTEPLVGGLPGKITSRRLENITPGDVGISIDEKPSKNIFEIITIPFPQYFISKFEIVIWTEHIQHMNEILEQLMTSYDDIGTVQANIAKLQTPKGYWFVAEFEKTITPDDNATNFADENRLIKHVINCSVKGYIVASAAPGLPGPFRRFVSAPNIVFESKAMETDISRHIDSPVMTSDVDKFVLHDVDIQDIHGNQQQRRGISDVRTVAFDIDPITGKKSTKYTSVPVKGLRAGERILRPARIEDLQVDVV